MRMSIEAPNAQAIAARLRRAPRTAADYIERNLRGLGKGLVEQMRRELRPVKDTGETERSVSFAYARSGDTWTLTVGPTARQREVIRTGRVPGAKPPPIGPLKAWARRKLGDEGAAYPIQRSIVKKGTSVYLQRLGIGEHVSGHGTGLNYPERTLARPYTQSQLKRTAERIPLDILAALEADAGGGA